MTVERGALLDERVDVRDRNQQARVAPTTLVDADLELIEVARLFVVDGGPGQVAHVARSRAVNARRSQRRNLALYVCSRIRLKPTLFGDAPSDARQIRVTRHASVSCAHSAECGSSK
jgi:hypothetical protein